MTRALSAPRSVSEGGAATAAGGKLEHIAAGLGTVRAVAGRLQFKMTTSGAWLIDDSAGYHRRYTSWKWSAGVGAVRDGRTVAWNLVEGINDPRQRSERTIWVAGEPTEPGPVEFQGLQTIHFEDESRLSFDAETKRTHHEGIPLIARSDYEAPFGSFTGTLNGLTLESALGVMEAHDVVW